MTSAWRSIHVLVLGLALAVVFSSTVVSAQTVAPPPSGKYWVYIGTYTKPGGSEGIHRCELDVATGALSNLKLVAKVGNPSFVNTSPDGKYLYAVAELADGGPTKKEGGVFAYAIDQKTGDLTLLNSMPSGGAHPCHLTVNHSGKYVIVANYTGGSTSVISINPDGSLDRQTDFRQHQGKSANPQRQEAPHAHCAKFVMLGDTEYAYVVDLGLDQVLSFSLDQKSGQLTPTTPAFVRLPAGSGPRHIAFNPRLELAYVCGELDSTVMTLKHSAKGKGVLELVNRSDAQLSTLPTKIAADIRSKNSTAEIVVHPGMGHVLVSNRGHNSLAVFSTSPDQTKAVGHVESSGEQVINIPRNFNIDPTGKWVLIASQDGDTVRSAEWSNGGAKLTAHSVAVGAPVCVKFLPKP